MAKDNVLKPSSKQKKLIKALEKRTGDKFSGTSMQDAIEYIEQHKDLIDKIDFREDKKPSKKMQEAIEKIERMYEVEFTGSTMKEASEFLDKYMPQYMEYWAEKRKTYSKKTK